MIISKWVEVDEWVLEKKKHSSIVHDYVCYIASQTTVLYGIIKYNNSYYKWYELVTLLTNNASESIITVLVIF